MKKILLIGMFVAACNSQFDPSPVGVGFDANELKTSPCACIQIENKPGLPEWFANAMA
ncbi:MAG: hypothetical protein FWD15_01370 [Alphaproteobacteria bacterium]|nr:hypothetical protein [Alphaproteobacteria bacterium]